MALLQRVTLLIMASLAAPGLWANDLAGFWQHEEQPAWIEIEFGDGSGSGSVRRNDSKPEAVGRVLLMELKSEGSVNNWNGQVYAEKLKEYKDAVITLPEPDRMRTKIKVGFISRKVNWTRVPAIPEQGTQE